MREQPISAYFLVRYVLARLDLDPEADRKEEVRKKSAAILRRLDGPVLGKEGSRGNEEHTRTRKEDLVLNQYEQAIAMEVIAPEDIPISFEGRLIYTGLSGAARVGSEIQACRMLINAISRHWWAYRYHRRTERKRHLPSYHAASLFTIIATALSSFGSLTVRSPRLWQDYARQGSCSREWRNLHQPPHFDLNGEVVWGFK